jgi:hypothetical protein
MEDLEADRKFTGILKLKVTKIIYYFTVKQIQPFHGEVQPQNVQVSYMAGNS